MKKQTHPILPPPRQHALSRPLRMVVLAALLMGAAAVGQAAQSIDQSQWNQAHHAPAKTADAKAQDHCTPWELNLPLDHGPHAVTTPSRNAEKISACESARPH